MYKGVAGRGLRLCEGYDNPEGLVLGSVLALASVDLNMLKDVLFFRSCTKFSL